MANAFAAGIGALFRDRNLAADVLYRAHGVGAGVTLRAILSQPDVSSDWQAARLRAESTMVDFLVADLPSVCADDVFVVDGVAMALEGEPLRDDHRLTWRLQLVPVD